ncbi:MAG: hypothetical protein ABIO35_04765 [Nitrobacter sp.]
MTGGDRIGAALTDTPCDRVVCVLGSDKCVTFGTPKMQISDVYW